MATTTVEIAIALQGYALKTPFDLAQQYLLAEFKAAASNPELATKAGTSIIFLRSK